MSTELLTINPAALPITSVEAYVARIGRIPVLTQAEERSLAERYVHHNDLAAAQQLVVSNLRFVVHIARTYAGYGLALSDLIQEGNIGLMKAVKRFDPSVGVRLVSFAVHWIKAEIQEFILRNWRIVKIATTKAQRKLFFNLRKFKQRLGWFNEAEMTAVANDLGVSPEAVREMESRLSGQDIGFDVLHEEEENDKAVAPETYLQDDRYEPTQQIELHDASERGQEQLGSALTKLDERSREIIQARWLAEPKATLHDLATRYSVSAERIRQLEQNAIKKLRAAVVTPAKST